MRYAPFPIELHKKQTGFTLVEVLVAMTVLAIGLLALAGVQANGLRSTHTAYERSQASIAAMDIADRMRANKAGVDANAYAAIASPPVAPVPASCVGTGVNCTPTQIAAVDAYEWLISLATDRDLLNPDGAVTCLAAPCVPGSMYQITIRWDGRRNGAVGQNCNPFNLGDKICYQVVVQP
ncbi:MAG TPA: type IV pilus modification protein PilV [Mariprofundaceae bacterium]|nr:type IV pilus modification protein PilV [Mariprofundaceae bacterium]